MDESLFRQPSPEQLEAFVTGDPVAEEQVLCLVLPQLYRWATHQYWNLPADEVKSEVNLVVHQTCRPRVKFDPRAGTTLTTYLIHLIQLRLNSLYQRRKKVADAEIAEPIESEKWHMQVYKESREDARITRDAFFDKIIPRLSEPEREFLNLMRHGEKNQKVFAAVLERNGKVSNPANQVKNMKERLLRKLRTFAEEYGYQLEDIRSD